MKLLKKIVAFILREYQISLKNFNDLFTILLFSFLSIFVFIFSIGSDKEILKSIGIGILWSLLLLSSTLSLKRYYQEDFENGTLVIIHMSGLSYELISILKIFSHFIFILFVHFRKLSDFCGIISVTSGGTSLSYCWK